MTNRSTLPVLEVLESLTHELKAHPTVILKAPPGAGKSTGLPLKLLNEPWLAGKKILMLEPRRLAAQSVANRLAEQLQERVGQTVGLRMRLHTKVSAETRLEIITEGVLTRLIQADPMLSDVGLVIFDEFHERSVNLDCALALCLDARRIFELGLKILVMSATLDEHSLQNLFPMAPVVQSQGRQYPVEVHHLRQNPTHLPSAVVAHVARALTEHAGDVLVFLPGVGEILAVKRLLDEHLAEIAVPHIVYTLYGDLPIEQQTQVLLPDTLNRRKIILSTNVAETSVTIDGVRVVIDSGLARRARFDPAIGFTRLELQKVACANLEQRRGRAGRTAPGVCYRLFTAADERQRPAFNAPEIMETDCAPLALEVLEWGTPVTELPWVDAPPKGSWQQAIDLLTQLDAIDAHRQLTPAGQAIRRFNAHPRLANMMLLSPKPLRRLACELAALLSERDLKRHDTDRDADVLHRLDLLHRQDTKASKRVLQIVTQFERLLEREPAANTATDAIHDAGSLLMFAYPDRIAKQQAPNRFLLTQGTSAYFDHVDALAKHEYLVVVEAQGSPQHPRIQLAASVDAGSIKRGFGHHLVEKNEIHIDHISQSVVKRSFKALGAVIFEERISRELSDDEALPVLMTQLKQQGINGFLQEPTVMHFLERCRFVKRALAVEKANEWPNFDEQSLLETLNEWLMPFCNGIRRLDNLRSVDWLSALRYRLTAPLQKQLDAFAPTHLTVPSGSNIRVDYASDPPRIAVRLQEVFGLKDTPRVADGTIALAIELLSPARRPVQLTRDLSSFWKTGYHEVRKELKGRYPKHYWPDDPLQSEPTARAKPRR